MKIALPKVRHLGKDAAELLWKKLPKGTRDLINEEADGYSVGELTEIDDLHRLIYFISECIALMEEDEIYDYNLPQSIDAAYMIASGMYSSGQYYQSVLLVFYAALLTEFSVNFENTITELTESPTFNIGSFAHIHCAVMNTHTTNLLRDFLIEKVTTQIVKKDTQSMLTNDNDFVLFKIGSNIPRRPIKTLITVFHQMGPDYYRELGLYANSSVSQAAKACMFDICMDDFHVHRELILAEHPKDIVKKCRDFAISVNDEAVYRISIYATNSIREIGVNEGDVIRVVVLGREQIVQNNEVKPYTGRPVSQKGRKKNSGKKRNGKSKRKTSNLASSRWQEPIEEQLKEAHSMKMESVLNEIRPQLQEIRQKVDSLTLERQNPKQRKDPQQAQSTGKENFTNNVSTSGGKAGKVAYPILVGLFTNLYISSKRKNARRSRGKVVSLDLHGLSKRKALDKLKKSLPQLVDVAMKGNHPFVIPVDIICGGGSQELSEVVANWIRNEKQVANRPKGYFI